MLIEKIKQVYKKRTSDEQIIRDLKNGKEVMFYYYEPAILLKLNLAIDWKYSKLPEGSKEELEEGDTFMFDGRPQIISIVDENTIKLVTSDTGPLALDRIVREIINPELKMLYSDISEIDLEWEVASDIEVDCTGIYTIPYESYKIIKNRLLPGREKDINPENYILKIDICGGNVPFMSTMYLDKSRLYYDSDFFEEDQMEYVSRDILNWMYKNIPVLGRHEFETEKAKREAEEQKAMMEKLLGSLGPLNQGNQSQGCSGNCQSCKNPCTNPNKTFNNP